MSDNTPASMRIISSSATTVEAFRGRRSGEIMKQASYNDGIVATSASIRGIKQEETVLSWEAMNDGSITALLSYLQPCARKITQSGLL